MTTTPELFALRDVCARLDGAGIGYMLTGSLAMSYYARPRMTRDIDLVIALAASDTGRLIDVLGEQYHADAVAIAEALWSAATGCSAGRTDSRATGLDHGWTALRNRSESETQPSKTSVLSSEAS